ncbi:hypothetical protein [Pseudomonas graminis]
MNRLKIAASALVGAILCLAALLAGFRRLALFITGPVLSNDEMNQNVVLFLISAPLSIVTGAIIGGFLMQRRLKKI